jgi:hypothetical protein
MGLLPFLKYAQMRGTGYVATNYSIIGSGKN